MARWLLVLAVAVAAFLAVVAARTWEPEPLALPELEVADAAPLPSPSAGPTKGAVLDASVHLDAPSTIARFEPLPTHIEVVEPPNPESVPQAVPAPPMELSFDAGSLRPKDPRFTVRWGEPGLCGDEPRAKIRERREALLGSFVLEQRAGATFSRAREVPSQVVDAAAAALTDARRIALELLSTRGDVPFAKVAIYENAEQMRGVACVSKAAAGYYDGTIHLAANDPDFRRTVIHEHVHHVLYSFGVKTPMWLHEGLAMYAAQEVWWQHPRAGLVPWLRKEHLPFDAMTVAFPHTADPLFAGAAYYQSYRMVEFITWRTRSTQLTWLVDRLVAGQVDPRQAFTQGLGLEGEALEREWAAFIEAR